MDYAFTYAKAHAMTTETNYPYKPVDRACNSAAVAKGTYRITGYTDVPAGSVSGL